MEPSQLFIQLWVVAYKQLMWQCSRTTVNSTKETYKQQGKLMANAGFSAKHGNLRNSTGNKEPRFCHPHQVPQPVGPGFHRKLLVDMWTIQWNTAHPYNLSLLASALLQKIQSNQLFNCNPRKGLGENACSRLLQPSKLKYKTAYYIVLFHFGHVAPVVVAWTLTLFCTTVKF